MIGFSRSVALVCLCVAPLLAGAAQPTAPSKKPASLSRVPSLQVERTAWGGAMVHNSSAHGVTALSVQTQNGSLYQVESGKPQPLIAPGATYELHMAPTFRTLVLQAALFDDGSYGGDTQTAAELEARRMGEEVQAQRIRSLVAPILVSNESDSARLQRILAAVTPLSITPDAPMLASFHARFPKLPNSGAHGAQDRDYLSRGLRMQKQGFVDALRQNARTLLTGRHPMPLAKWWALGCALCGGK